MSKKQTIIDEGAIEAPASEWIVITAGARLPNGVMMEIGTTFTLESAGYSEAHVVNLLNERVIEPVAKPRPVVVNVEKPFTRKVTQKIADDSGDNS